MSKKQKETLEKFFNLNNRGPGTSNISESSDDDTVKNETEKTNSPKTKGIKSSNNRIRKYYRGYIKYGFVSIEVRGTTKPQCVICGVVLSNESMKPNKLWRHLNLNHDNYKNKTEDFFIRKRDELKNQKTLINVTTTTNNDLLKASFIAALYIAKAKKPFTIAEELLKPAMVNICKELFEPFVSNKIKEIPLSNDTIYNRTLLIANDLQEQLTGYILNSPWFSLQIDESTDVSNKSICLGYIRFIDFIKMDISEEFLFCIDLETDTTSENIFNKIDSFLNTNGLLWKNCVGICTDGAASMTGCYKGITSRIKRIAHANITTTHCFIHREQLASKEMSAELNEVMIISVKIINFIKGSSLKSRLFSIFCEEVGADNSSLLFHTDVRWLSRGKILTRLFELRLEVELFLNDTHSSLSSYFDDNNWVAKLSYLADIFTILNQLNISMQGPKSDIFTMHNKIEAMKMKLQRWIQRIDSNIYEMFPFYSQLISDSKFQFEKENVNYLIKCHILKLIDKFEKYFPNDEGHITKLWIQDPYNNYKNTNLSSDDEDSLLELINDCNLKSLFKTKSLPQFWIQIRAEYPPLFSAAMQNLLPFASTYLCEKGFSTMVDIKTKKRNRLRLDSCMRIALQSIEPRINKLVDDVQQQKSH